MRRALAGLVFALLPAAALAGDLPVPKFDRVDHARPEKYLDLPAKLGKPATIKRIAGEIKGETPRAKLAAIGSWISSHLKNDPKTGYEFRDIDRILADGTFGGCQDHAEVFGALARACGIPTVWVKTMDADWIRMFRRTRDENRTWSGHVFLEVHVDGRWLLLDATQGVLHEDYDVRQRILPGNRYAYDKGGDYYELLMSDRWEDWKKQTAAFFRDFDLSVLPVGEGIPLPRPGTVVVLGDNPGWQWAVDRVAELGKPCGGGGNDGFDRFVPQAAQGSLVVLCVDGRVVLPRERWSLLPERWEEAVRKNPSGVIRRQTAEGMKVLLVHARDEEGLRAEIAKLRFD